MMLNNEGGYHKQNVVASRALKGSVRSKRVTRRKHALTQAHMSGLNSRAVAGRRHIPDPAPSSFRHHSSSELSKVRYLIVRSN